MKLDKNDPKLTACALGELSETERQAIEKELETNPEARETVEKIRALGEQLSEHYASEDNAELTGVQRTAIALEARKKSKQKIIPFPRYRWLIAIGSAAAIAVLFIGFMNCFVVVKSVQKKSAAFSSPDFIKSENSLALAQPAPASEPLAYTQPKRDYRKAPAMTKSLQNMQFYSSVAAIDTDAGRPPSQFGPSIEAYNEIRENPFQRVVDHPLSTFSIDVDTASYSNMRRFLQNGNLPPKDAIRIEELINYFNYNYAPPTGSTPFATHLEQSICPWNTQHKLVRIGLKGRVLETASRPPLNLVFLLDVSGSMNNANKLPLVKRAMALLTQQMNEQDHVSIVVYAGASGLVLPPTSGANRPAIMDALERLSAGGGTNGGEGIELAYRNALQNFNEQGVNRVVLCTDGDFNIGVTQGGDLNRLIEEKAKSGIFLSVLGFGAGNYKDSTMEQLADRGNGNYAYIDTFSEARKVLADQMTGTLITIAKDVKIQVEFNPARVAGYRLIGYENRMLKPEDFNDDKKDAGEIGAGHTVTALYEVVPAGLSVDGKPPVDALKYQVNSRPGDRDSSRELLTVKLRYKEPRSDVSTKVSFPLMDSDNSFTQADPDFRFAATVAGFGMILRESQYKGSLSFDQILEWAVQSQGTDPFGYRREFTDLVRNAQAIGK